MPKLLVLKPFPLLRLNGGDISLIERLEIIQSWGVQTKVVHALPELDRPQILQLAENQGAVVSKGSYQLGALSCEVAWGPLFHPHDLRARRPVEEFFLGVLRQENPDLVWTHYTDYFATSAALKWNPSKLWIDQTDDEYPRLQKLNEFDGLGEIYEQARYMMVASRFMKSSVRKSFSKVHSVYTPNPIADYRECTRRKSPWNPQSAWIHVNPAAVKGIDFTIELAKALPNEKFWIVGNWGAEMPASLPANIQTVDRQASLRTLFSEAKGLLVPSRWQEAFGRLPLEAMSCGLPVIASDRGGLPESVGQGGVLLPLDQKLWIEAMTQPESFWRPQIEAGYRQFEDYRKRTDRRYAALKKLWGL